jgi:hypothetical protein
MCSFYLLLKQKDCSFLFQNFIFLLLEFEAFFIYIYSCFNDTCVWSNYNILEIRIKTIFIS